MIVKDSAAAPNFFLTSVFGVEKLESIQKDGISSKIDASTAKGSNPKMGSIHHDYNLDCINDGSDSIKKSSKAAIPCNIMPYDYLRNDENGKLTGIVFVIYTC